MYTFKPNIVYLNYFYSANKFLTNLFSFHALSFPALRWGGRERGSANTRQMFFENWPAAVYENRPTERQMLTKIGQQMFLKIGQQLFKKIGQQMFHTIETDGRQAGANQQMFLTYTIETADAHTIDGRQPFVTPGRFFCLFFNWQLYHY